MTPDTIVSLLGLLLLALTWIVPGFVRKMAKNKNASEYYEMNQLANLLGVCFAVSGASFFIANLIYSYLS